MDIQHTQPQANNITTTPICSTDHPSSEMVSTVRKLHQQDNIPNCLRLTHKIVDKQIEGLVQEMSLSLNNLQKQLNTLKNAGVFQNNEDPMKTIACHVAIALVDINKATTLKNNLEILKQRDFKPIQEGALTVRLSAKALGGMESRNITQERKQRINSLKAQKETLKQKIQRWEKDFNKSQEKLNGFKEKVRTYGTEMSEILATEGDLARQQYKEKNSKGIADAELCVEMQKVEHNRVHQQLVQFRLTLTSVQKQLATEENLLHPEGSSIDIGCSSGRRWGF